MKAVTIAAVKCLPPVDESPLVSLQRMCFGYLHNDWITVAASGLRLFVALGALLLSGIAPAGTNG